MCGRVGRELRERFGVVQWGSLLETTGADADEAIGDGLFAGELRLTRRGEERTFKRLSLYTKRELGFECAGGADAMDVVPAVGAGGATATEAEVAHAHEGGFECHA